MAKAHEVKIIGLVSVAKQGFAEQAVCIGEQIAVLIGELFAHRNKLFALINWLVRIS